MVALVPSENKSSSSPADTEQTVFCSPTCLDLHRLSFVWSVFLKTVKVTMRLLQLPLRLLLSVVKNRSITYINQKNGSLRRAWGLTSGWQNHAPDTASYQKTDGCHLGLNGDGNLWPIWETAAEFTSFGLFWFEFLISKIIFGSF